MTDAEITLRECTNDSRLERLLFGTWWWHATVGNGSRSGFARSREKAQAKAEAAARKLATEEHAPFERYQYEVSGDG